MGAKLKTVWDVRKDRTEEEARWAMDDAEKARAIAFLGANPQIGILHRKGQTVYYVNSPTYREATDPEQLAN